MKFDPYKLPQIRGIRKISDSKFLVINPTRQLIRDLCEAYVRINDNTFLLKPTWSEAWLQLGSLICDKTVCIVGKGPSLDHLDDTYFEESDVIFAVNEAIHKVEQAFPIRPTYVLQQDTRLHWTCIPRHSRMIVSKSVSKILPENMNPLVYEPAYFAADRTTITAVIGVKIAKEFKAKKIRLCCFDGATEAKYEYAKCVGYLSTRFGDAYDRFKDHRKQIERAAGEMPLEWINPQDPSVLISETLLPSLHNHREHYADDLPDK